MYQVVSSKYLRLNTGRETIKTRTFLVFAILLSTGYFLLAAPVLAQSLSSQVLSLSIVNPDGPMSQVRVVLDIPKGFTPVDSENASGWDTAKNQMNIALGSMAPGETRPVSVTLSAPPGVYTITGKTYGVWDEVAKPFSSDITPIVLVFKAPSAILGNAPSGASGVNTNDQSGTLVDDLRKQLADNPEVAQVAETISLPIAISLGGIGVVSLLTSAYTASASFAAALSRIASYIGFGLFRLKKRKPWGRVLNHLTGQPIAGVVVKMLDAAFKKVKETQTTDNEGRFGFLVEPGEYLLKFSRNGFGEHETKVFGITNSDQVINMEISMEPLKTTLADYAMGVVRFWHRLNWFLAKINPVILSIGLLASLVSVLLTPIILNYVILGSYGVLIVLNIIFAFVLMRSYGRILDKASGEAISLAVVRLFNVKENWLLGTHVSDQKGRFNFLIEPGSYYVTVARNDFAPYQSQPVHFSRASIVNYDIKLDKQV